MHKLFRDLGAALALAGLAVGLAAGAAQFLSERKRQRVVPVQVEPVPYAHGPVAVERGQYLYQTRGCVAPISSFRHMNNTDLRALYAYLKSPAPAQEEKTAVR